MFYGSVTVPLRAASAVIRQGKRADISGPPILFRVSGGGGSLASPFLHRFILLWNVYFKNCLRKIQADVKIIKCLWILKKSTNPCFHYNVGCTFRLVWSVLAKDFISHDAKRTALALSVGLDSFKQDMGSAGLDWTIMRCCLCLDGDNGPLWLHFEHKTRLNVGYLKFSWGLRFLWSQLCIPLLSCRGQTSRVPSYTINPAEKL